MKIKQQIQRFVWPLIMMNFLQLMIGQLLLAIAARESVANLSGIHTIESFLFAITGILGAFNYAFNIKTARAQGEGQMRKAQEYLRSSLVLDVGIGLVVMVVILIGGRQLLHVVYGFRGELLLIATRFLLIMAPYVLINLLIFTFSNQLKVAHKTAWILRVSISAAVLQILLNLLLVNVWQLAIVGAGMAAILSAGVTAFLYGWLLRKELHAIHSVPGTRVKELVQFGLPLMWQEILEGVLFIIIFEALIARLGVKVLASYAIAAQLFALVKMPTFMYAQAVSIFLPTAYGKKDCLEMKTVFRYSLCASSLFYACLAIVSLCFAKPLASLFTGDQALLATIYRYVLIVLCAMFCSPVYEISKYTLQALEQERYVLWVTALSNCLILGIMVVAKQFFQADFLVLYLLNGANTLLLSVLFLRKWQRSKALVRTPTE